MNIALFNTFEEIIEALLTSQKQRLQKTKSAGAVLQNLRSPADLHWITDRVDMSRDVQTRLKVRPPPRNTDPYLHKEITKARVAFLRKQLENKKNDLYIDAVSYNENNASLVIFDHKGVMKDCLTLARTTADEAETGALLP